MNQVETHFVQYYTDRLLHTSGRLLHMFAVYSDIPRAENWTKSLSKVKEVLDNNQPVELLWHGEGIDLYFSGLQEPRMRIETSEEGQPKTVFQSPEPYFSIREHPEMLLPSERTHFLAVIDSISSEMEDTYKIRYERKPVKLVFPEKYYAQETLTASALILSNLRL